MQPAGVLGIAGGALYMHYNDERRAVLKGISFSKLPLPRVTNLVNAVGVTIREVKWHLNTLFLKKILIFFFKKIQDPTTLVEK